MDQLVAEGERVKAAALTAARAGRERLAEAMALLQDEPERHGVGAAAAVETLLGTLSEVIAGLYILEVAGLARARDELGRAMTALRHTLHELHAHPPPGPSMDAVGDRIARALATLYPARRELDRVVDELTLLGLERGGDEKTSPLLLAPSRRKARKTSRLLLVVPEDDEAHEDEAAFERLAPERRDGHRTTIETAIGLHSSTRFYTGFSADLSAGGLFVATYNVLPVGTRLTVSFLLPGGPHVSAWGDVAWVCDPHSHESDSTPGMGIRFTELREEDRQAIVTYIEAQAAQEASEGR